MSRNIEKSLLDIDFASLTRGPFTPSPAAWEDQVLYFLMLDRFSDGNERRLCRCGGPARRDRRHAAVPARRRRPTRWPNPSPLVASVLN